MKVSQLLKDLNTVLKFYGDADALLSDKQTAAYEVVLDSDSNTVFLVSKNQNAELLNEGGQVITDDAQGKLDLIAAKLSNAFTDEE